MVKNLESAKELVELYRSITIEQLKEVYNKLYTEDGAYFEGVIHEITGFGSVRTCHLCKPINGFCPDCIHGQGESYTMVCPCINDETYENIENAESIQDLYDAIQARADYIESLIKRVENGN